MDDKKLFRNAIIFVIVTIIISLIVYVGFFWSNPISKNTQDWAAFITYVSGITGVIISGIGTYLLYKTLMVSIKSFYESKESGRIQQFEGLLFKLIENHTITINNLSLDVYFKGTSALSEYSIKLRGKYGIAENLLFRTHYFSSKNNLDDFSPTYFIQVKNLISEDSNIEFLNQYFRSTFQILKYVWDSDLKNKQHYIEIFESLKSDHELFLIFAKGIISSEKWIRELIDETNILRNLPISVVENPFIKEHFYPKTNFTEQYGKDKFIAYRIGMS